MAALTGDAGSSNPLVPDRKYGVWGQSDDGYGVVGTSNRGNGVQGGSLGGFGIVGTIGNSTGVYGQSNDATGIYGRSDKSGQFEEPPAPTVFGGVGVFGENNQILGIGVRAHAGGQGGIGVYSSAVSFGVYGVSQSGLGVAGYSTSNRGVQGFSNSDVGVYGVSESATGVQGFSTGNTGVAGQSKTSVGVQGINSNSERIGDRPGVRGDGDAEDGVWAISQKGNGLYAQGGSSSANYAAYLRGKVFIAGPLVKPGGSFQIDHPLDPANKYLHHSFVESPDMKNIYDGIVVLDAKGQAEVELPAWFHALNSEFRYQLTPIGASGPSLHIAQEIKNNRFRIAGGAPGIKVSWQVTGVRVDAWAKAHRIQIEEDKPADERGRYLHPELYSEPEEKAIDWALRSAARIRPRRQRDIQVIRL